MRIIVHSSFSGTSIKEGLGKPDYSYYFVLQGYLPALERLGTVITVSDPGEVDAAYDAARAAGEDAVFLSFAPPHFTTLGLRCPTIPVVAWEFTTLPDEAYGDDPRGDWRVVFRACGRAITLSGLAARLVAEAMGPNFPVFAIPTATYDAFAAIAPPRAAGLGQRRISFQGHVLDSDQVWRLHVTPTMPPGDHTRRLPPVPGEEIPEAALLPPPYPPAAPAPDPVAQAAPEPPPPPAARLSARGRVGMTLRHGAAWYRDVVRDLLPVPAARLGSRAARTALRLARARRPPVPDSAPAVAPEPALTPPPAPPAPPAVTITLRGVVYTSVFSPADGRKNWHDMVTAFVYAFRDELGATLVLKLTPGSRAAALPEVEHLLWQLGPFRCRVLAVFGFLDDADYAGLIRASTYYVNSSGCEGLCLPLMEFLSAGRPAIAPTHTAMADYVSPDAAFTLQASLEHNVWPHDPRDVFRTMRYRLDWSSIRDAYVASFSAARRGDGAYGAMAQAAQDGMRGYCGLDVVTAKLAEALAAPLVPAGGVAGADAALAA